MKKLINFHYAGLFLLAIFVFLFISYSMANAQDITFAMDWMINGTHAPYYVALDKGFYKEAGLKVEIVRGYGSGDTVKKVAAKRATFGVCDFGALVTSVTREKTPVKALAAVYGKAMLGILYLKESGIKTPKDLEGRVLGRSASGAGVIMLPAFIKANNIDRSKIKEVVVDATSFLPMLLSKQVDAVVEQKIHEGRFQKAAEEGGQKVTVMCMLYSDFGLETYGNVIFTHNEIIDKDPALIKKFLQASLKGLTYAFANPEESVAILSKTNPQVTKERAMEELLAVKGTWSPEMLKTGLGFMTQERTRNSVDSITRALDLKKPESLDLIYTDRLVK